MKLSDIKVGKTYVNRGAGRTRRTVISIGTKIPPRWYSSGPRPNEPGVLYEQEGVQDILYLSSFAGWCGKEVSS